MERGSRFDGQDSIPDRGKNFFSTPQRPEALQDPPSFPYKVLGALSLKVKLTANFHLTLTPWSESASELYRPSDRRLLVK
jgi:hypothetical protein